MLSRRFWGSEARELGGVGSWEEGEVTEAGRGEQCQGVGELGEDRWVEGPSSEKEREVGRVVGSTGWLFEPSEAREESSMESERHVGCPRAAEETLTDKSRHRGLEEARPRAPKQPRLKPTPLQNQRKEPRKEAHSLQTSRRRRRKSLRSENDPPSNLVEALVRNVSSVVAGDDSSELFHESNSEDRGSRTSCTRGEACGSLGLSPKPRLGVPNDSGNEVLQEQPQPASQPTDSTSRRIFPPLLRPSQRHQPRSPLLFTLLLCSLVLLPQLDARQNHHRTCPGCPHQHVHTVNRKAAAPESLASSEEPEPAPSPDDLRLEAIKHQILSKLGLRTRPDVNRTLSSVPRHLALETLSRTEDQPPGHEEAFYEGPPRGEERRAHEESGRDASSYGQYYYAGEEYTYRNVDALENGEEVEEEDSGVVDQEHEANLAERHFEGGYAHRGGEPEEEEEASQVEMDDFYARTSEIITFAEPGCTLNGQPLLEFPRSSGDPALEPLRIKKATLWARVELRHPHHYQHHRRSSGQRNITLWVFKVRCGNVTHLRGKELGQHLDMVTSLSVNVNQLGWQKFDVTKVVSSWYSGHESALTRHEKLTLLVDCTGCGSHVHVSTFGVQTPNVVESSVNTKGEQDPDRPFLVVRTDPAAVKRVRRRAIECSGAVKGQCCKQRFYVSFSQLGWDDWIIAPQGYYANYCRGDCAARHRTPDTFLNYYTHVIEEYRKMDRLAGMQPCCAPVKFSPMSLIYYGPDSNIIKRDLPKMVVDECGCP